MRQTGLSLKQWFQPSCGMVLILLLLRSLDRLAREYRIQEQLFDLSWLPKGINLISANTGENVTRAITADPMKKAMVQMQGIFAELG